MIHKHCHGLFVEREHMINSFFILAEWSRQYSLCFLLMANLICLNTYYLDRELMLSGSLELKGHMLVW